MKHEPLNPHVDLEAYRTWLFDKDARKRTIIGYTSDLKIFASWFYQSNGKDLSPACLTPADVREYREHLVRQGGAPALINRHLAAIRSYGEWGIATGAIKNNPAKEVRIVKDGDQVAPRWLGKADQKRLVAALEDNLSLARTQPAKFLAIRDQAIVLTLLNTGVRLSELCALKLSDLDFSERKGSIRVRDGKGGKARTIPANDTTRKAIRAWLEIRPPNKLENLFTGYRGDALTSTAVHRRIVSLGKQAKIDDEVSPHVLRHTFAKNLINAGEGLEKVAALLGHANLNTTRRYITPDENDLQRAVDKLD